MAARFAPVDLTADIAALPANERQALAKLVEAAKVFDALFLRQVWDGNETMLLDLVARRLAARACAPALLPDQQGTLVAARSQRAVHRRRCRRSPPQANFYPAGATKEEVEAWIKALSARRTRRAPRASSRRFAADADGKFIAVPYSLEYQGELARVATLLREAAALTTQPTLKSYLEKRAAALLSNDYYDSDVAWMELDASASSRRSARTRSTKTSGSTTRRRSRRSSRCATTRRRRSWRASGPSCRRSRTTCRSIRSTATRSSARWRRSASSTPCSRRATPIAACRRRPSTCPTTSASSPRRARSA